MDDLVEQLKGQIIAALKLDHLTPEKVDPAAPLFASGLGLDSVDALELVVMLEKHYGIRITDIAVGRKAFASIDAMAEYIRENGKG
jgi:acyl carrier protein